eukprot:12046027-Heterocapsa_arctica.AAC.1
MTKAEIAMTCDQVLEQNDIDVKSPEARFVRTTPEHMKHLNKKSKTAASGAPAMDPHDEESTSTEASLPATVDKSG